MIPEANCEVGRFCVAQWKKFQNKEIAYPELEKEMVYCSLDMVNEYKYCKDEIAMPRELAEYYAVDKYARKASENFWRKTDIKAYFDAKSEIRSQNISNFEWLRTMKRVLKDDKVSLEKVTRVIDTFPFDQVGLR